MKKIFIMSVLLAITAHAVSSAGRYTSFMRNVLCSGTGIAAGITGLYAVSSLYVNNLLVRKETDKAFAASVVPHKVDKEIHRICKQSGVNEQVNIIIGGDLSPSTMFDGDCHILKVPEKCIQVLQQGAVVIRCRGQKVVLTEDQVRFMIAHETGHMKHPHFDNAISAGFDISHIPLTLLAGKAAHVAGRFKGIAVSFGALYWLAHAGMHASFKRAVEKRCDMSIDNDIAYKGMSALLILQYFEKIEEIEISNVILDIPFAKLLIYLNGKIFPTHPSYPERRKYMQKKITNKKYE